MRTRIVRIGNSRGIRIPKALLEEVGLGSEDHPEVELTLVDGSLVIRPLNRVRRGWAEAAAALAEAEGPDREDPFIPTDFDESEWVW